MKTLETTPPGETHWSTRTMAKAAGMSHTMVGRIWRTFGLQPHVTETFKLSPDPQLVEKIRDVVGLYMARRTMRWCSRSTRSRRSRRSNARNRSCRWTSANPNDGPTITSGMARWISSPR